MAMPKREMGPISGTLVFLGRNRQLDRDRAVVQRDGGRLVFGFIPQPEPQAGGLADRDAVVRTRCELERTSESVTASMPLEVLLSSPTQTTIAPMTALPAESMTSPPPINL